MLHKRLALLVILLVLPAIACVDVLAVPGVKVSPDGNTIYFLDSSMEVDGEQVFRLAQSALGSGVADILIESDSAIQSAFAVNPVNGDVAFYNTTQDGATSLQVISTDGSVRELIDAETMGVLGLATDMAYSPDGNTIALTMLILPDTTLLESTDLEGEEPDLDFAELSSALFLVDANTGTGSLLTNADTQWASTVTWSPSGQALAYNAWVDTNGDGMINISGGSPTDSVLDASEIYVYDVASGTTTQLTNGELAHAPAFLSDTQLAYAVFSADPVTGISTDRIDVYDLGSSTSQIVYTLEDGLILGMATAPNGSQVAWIELNQISGGEANTGGLLVADLGFTEVRTVNPLTEILHPADPPVWTPDSSAVLVSSTNFVSALLGNLAGSFTDDPNAIPQQVFRIDVASGAAELVYTGSISNSNLYAALLGLVASDFDEQLGGDF